MIKTLRHLRHRPSLLAGFAVAVVATATASLSLRATTAVLIGWDLGVIAYIVTFLVVIRHSTTDSLQRVSALLDEGRWGVLAVTIVAALASLGAIVAELAQVHGKSHAGWIEGLAGATVVLSWFFIHMIFTTHYA
ncbi:MAG: DUF1345 domain-containing protein, partial [Janthinobacterium lividum]